MERVFGYFLIWLALAGGLAVVIGKNAQQYYQLNKRGVLTVGIAVARLPHRQIRYSFSAGNRTYSGVGRTGKGAPPFERISIGEKLPVYYLADDPEVSCLGNPGQLLQNELPPVVGVVVLFPIIIILAFRFRKGRNWP
jgi:hypothetical protein